MGLENLLNAASDFFQDGGEQVNDSGTDFLGDISEEIGDISMDVGEFSKAAVEAIGENGMEALENGDLERALDCVDMPEECRDVAGGFLENLGEYKDTIKSVSQIAVGTLGTIAALATPGFQPAGLAAAASVIKGATELAMATA